MSSINSNKNTVVAIVQINILRGQLKSILFNHTNFYQVHNSACIPGISGKRSKRKKDSMTYSRNEII